MADITMCNREDCDTRHRCRRSPASGTRPGEIGQSWIFWNDQIKAENRPCAYLLLPGDQPTGSHSVDDPQSFPYANKGWRRILGGDHTKP